jgi:hypothetical protein
MPGMLPEWRDNMWGIWMDTQKYPKHQFEIPMHGLGLFASRKDSWLGFNPGFRGFGGEEGYIHAKYAASGRKTLCLPCLGWLHRFSGLVGVKYPLNMRDRVRNYLIGFKELGLDITPIQDHFGRSMVDKINEEL